MIFEAVPNISLGEDSLVLPLLSAAITGASSLQDPVKLLDQHFDIDHNRAVFTYIGSKDGVIKASLALLAVAYEKISMETHRGVHPFRGVVDVLPIIPLLDTSEAAAISLAKEIGEKAKDIFEVPVFYYDLACPNKTTLPSLRKQLRSDKDHLGSEEKKGALMIGVRGFLVAYNINLSCFDLALAKKIAVAIREINSGLLGVRALGLELPSRHQVQVSMNLTKPLKVSTKIVYNEVKSLLRTYQKQEVQLTEELVGMLPEEVIKKAKEMEKKDG